MLKLCTSTNFLPIEKKTYKVEIDMDLAFFLAQSRAYTFIIMVYTLTPHPVVSPVQFVADAIVRVLRGGFIFDFYIS